MSKKKDKKNGASKSKGANKGPDVELTPDQQSEKITEALDVAVGAGIPSASEIKAMFMLAETFWNSGMFKAAGSPAGCFVKMLYGREKGLKMIESMTNIDIVDGSPAMSSQFMLAKFQADGGSVEWLQRDERGARGIFRYGNSSGEFGFTLSDAETAGLKGKNTHGKYPRVMMSWRCIAEAIRFLAPGCLLKAYTYGELSDEQAQSMEELAGMVALPGPGHTNKPDGSSKPSTPAGRASAQKVGFIRDKLKWEAVPKALAHRITTWLDSNKDEVMDSAATKTIAIINKFEIRTVGRSLEPASQKQMEFLAKLSASSSIPEEVVFLLGGMKKPFTKSEASAWIESLSWIVEDAKKSGGSDPTPATDPAPDPAPASKADDIASDNEDLPFNEDGSTNDIYSPNAPDDLDRETQPELSGLEVYPPGSPEALAQEELRDYSDRKDALVALLKTKKAPLKRALNVITNWIEDGPDTEKLLSVHEATVAAWPDLKKKGGRKRAS